MLAARGGDVGEGGHEQRFAGEHAFAGGGHLAPETAARGRRIAEHRVHLNAGRHIHHAARLGDHHFARIERDFDILHLRAEDLVVNLVGAAAARNGRRPNPGQSGRQGRHVSGLDPIGRARPVH